MSSDARRKAEEALRRVLANAAAIVRLSWSDGATAADCANMERIKSAAADIARDHKILRALLAATEPGAGEREENISCPACNMVVGRTSVAQPPPPAQDADSAVALLLAVWDAWHRVGYEPEETIDEVINRVGDWRWNNGFDEFNPPTKPVPPWPGIRERDEEIASLRAELAEWTEARQRFAADRARLDASLAPRPAQDAVREAAELAHLDLLSYDEAVTGNEKRHALLRCKNALRDVLRTIDAALDAAKEPK